MAQFVPCRLQNCAPAAAGALVAERRRRSSGREPRSPRSLGGRVRNCAAAQQVLLDAARTRKAPRLGRSPLTAAARSGARERRSPRGSASAVAAEPLSPDRREERPILAELAGAPDLRGWIGRGPSHSWIGRAPTPAPPPLAQQPSLSAGARQFFHSVFASNPLFRHVTPAEERLLLDAFEPIAFASGTVIITQGERHGDKFYVVEDGTCTYAVDGRVVGACGRGGAFGERALLQDAPRAATVTAATAVLAWALDKPHFEAVLARSVPKPPPTATSSASLWQRGGSAVRAAVRLRRFASNESDAQKRWRARARACSPPSPSRVALQRVRDHARSLPAGITRCGSSHARVEAPCAR